VIIDLSPAQSGTPRRIQPKLPSGLDKREPSPTSYGHDGTHQDHFAQRRPRRQGSPAARRRSVSDGHHNASGLTYGAVVCYSGLTCSDRQCSKYCTFSIYSPTSRKAMRPALGTGHTDMRAHETRAAASFTAGIGQVTRAFRPWVVQSMPRNSVTLLHDPCTTSVSKRMKGNVYVISFSGGGRTVRRESVWRGRRNACTKPLYRTPDPRANGLAPTRPDLYLHPYNTRMSTTDQY
jgi:hypothetical protein